MSLTATLDQAAEIMFSALFHPFAMLAYGMLLHVLKNLRDLERAGTPQTFRQYTSRFPYSTGFSVLAGVVAYGFLYSSGQLNVASAFTAGYMADSIVNAFTNRTLRVLEQGP